jgi:hypothetical protein|tara:strand:+ start:522 stop:827 length:306 start_codon:yes stop_codon:yes gene_type:complete
MNRYRFTKLLKDENGIRFRSITEYPKIVRKDTDVVYYTKFGDSYSSLAYKHYKDVSLWWIIARANEGFKGNVRLPINTKLNIPTEIGEILSDLERLNNRVE